MRMSASDAVDGSSTGTQVPRIRELLGLPRSGGAIHADNQDNRTRHRQVGFFQVHGIDAAGQGVIRRKLKRRFVLSFFEKLPPPASTPAPSVARALSA